MSILQAKIQPVPASASSTSLTSASTSVKRQTDRAKHLPHHTPQRRTFFGSCLPLLDDLLLALVIVVVGVLSGSPAAPFLRTRALLRWSLSTTTTTTTGVCTQMPLVKQVQRISLTVLTGVVVFIIRGTSRRRRSQLRLERAFLRLEDRECCFRLLGFFQQPPDLHTP